MNPLGTTHRDKRRVQITVNLKRDPVHLKRNQRRQITPSVHVRLITRHIRVVDDHWVRNHGVNQGDVGYIDRVDFSIGVTGAGGCLSRCNPSRGGSYGFRLGRRSSPTSVEAVVRFSAVGRGKENFVVAGGDGSGYQQKVAGHGNDC
ncbi:hypothetical protein L1987_59816 [Smallanthus sonchifolius]|uniref:Uncharacterized protein n=1 Tax=Smallanthus sonchifolius TaxID=185202 RepID=A0ACB9D718_9ASTR|nr:hypothetical protein L1987_59816 [Smallanthus sonchifolius]